MKTRTCDNWGTFCYIRDVASGVYWSTAYQPVHKASKKYEAIFSEGRAEFRRRDEDIDTHTEIAVSPEDDAEVRRITITNRSETARTIDVTSYSEVVLGIARCGRAPPGLQQSLRSNRDRPAPEGDHRHPPTPFR